MNEVDPLFARPLLPVANEEDAVRTLSTALPYVRAVDGRVTVLHVIEKAGGAPDKAPLEAREEMAENIFERAREAGEGVGSEVETELRYGTDVAGTILAAADETDATAIVFSPRGGRAWWDLFSGGVREALTTESDLPVVVLPDRESASPPADADSDGPNQGADPDDVPGDADDRSGGDGP